MRSSICIFSLVVTFAAAVVHGGEAEINLQSWDGTSDLQGGWTQTKLKKSSTYNDGAQFSGGDYSLTSPQFTGTVQTVSVRLTCSTANPARILKLIPILPDGSAGEPQKFDEPETVESYEWQFKDIESCGVDQFKIGLNSGASGNWYVLSVKVIYDETRPIDHPVKPEPEVDHVSLTNCWKVSQFVKLKGGRCFHDADFSYLAAVKKETDWVNGVSIDSFYSLDDGKPSTQVKNATASSRNHGLYAIHTNDEQGVINALGLLPSGEAAMEIFLPVELDAEQKVNGITLEYRCWQPKIGTEETTLSFSWCATDTLDEIEKSGWVLASEGNYSGGGDGPVKKVEIAGRDFRGAKFLCFKWSVPKQSNSSLLGISDLRVTADLNRSGFALLIR